MSPKRSMLVIVGKAAISDKWNPIMKEEKGSSHVDKKKHRYVSFVFIEKISWSHGTHSNYFGKQP